MQLLDLFERAGRLPAPYNPKQVDPALLTAQEYYRLANPSEKHHPDEAYDTTVERLNRHGVGISDYPHLIRRVKIKGLYFEFRLKTEKINYTKRTPDGEFVRDENNQLVYFTDAEVQAMGWRPHEFSIGVFNEEKQRVASAQDEWNCMLIMVAREYRNFGLGTILGKIARTFEPGKNSGGFTWNGSKNFSRVHREFVRDALTSGRYMQMVKDGRITLARVKEIIASASLENKLPKSNENFGSNDPKDWLLYIDHESGAFAIYDRKLKDLIDAGDDVHHWAEKMIKGYLFIRIPGDWMSRKRSNQSYGIEMAFGADSPKIKGFLLTLGAAWCKQEGVDFLVDEDDLQYVDTSRCTVGPITLKSGFRRASVEITTNEFDDLASLGIPERHFRKKFDPHDEFRWEMIGMAEGKYRKSTNESVMEALGYHGTGGHFTAFKFAKSDTHPSKIGVWFSSKPEPARHIARMAFDRDRDARARVITADIELGNVKRYATYADFQADYRDVGSSAAKLRRKLMSQGFNSIEITHSDTDGAGERTDWAVFDSWQIRIVGSTPVSRQ